MVLLAVFVVGATSCDADRADPKPQQNPPAAQLGDDPQKRPPEQKPEPPAKYGVGFSPKVGPQFMPPKEPIYTTERAAQVAAVQKMDLAVLRDLRDGRFEEARRTNEQQMGLSAIRPAAQCAPPEAIEAATAYARAVAILQLKLLPTDEKMVASAKKAAIEYAMRGGIGEADSQKWLQDKVSETEQIIDLGRKSVSIKQPVQVKQAAWTDAEKKFEKGAADEPKITEAKLKKLADDPNPLPWRTAKLAMEQDISQPSGNGTNTIGTELVLLGFREFVSVKAATVLKEDTFRKVMEKLNPDASGDDLYLFAVRWAITLPTVKKLGAEAVLGGSPNADPRVVAFVKSITK